MSAAAAVAQPVPDIFEYVSVRDIGIGDVIQEQRNEDIMPYIYIITNIMRDASDANVTVRKLDQLNKVFIDEEQGMRVPLTYRVKKVKCPQLAPAPAAAGAGAGTAPRSTSGGSRRKRSTSRNNRKLRKA